MISRIRGTLLHVTEQTLVVDVAGVGYELEVATSVLAQMPQVGEEIIVHTHFVVREDAQLLFGFASISERDLFRAYIKLNGVGPKLGLALISALDMQTLVAAVHNNDVSALTKVPGVGKKTAERLLLELKSRIDSLTENGTVAAQVVSVQGWGGSDPARTQPLVEAERALVALGYRSTDAASAIRQVTEQTPGDSESLSVEELVRQALRGIARQSGMGS